MKVVVEFLCLSESGGECGDLAVFLNGGEMQSNALFFPLREHAGESGEEIPLVGLCGAVEAALYFFFNRDVFLNFVVLHLNDHPLKFLYFPVLKLQLHTTVPQFHLQRLDLSGHAHAFNQGHFLLCHFIYSITSQK